MNLFTRTFSKIFKSSNQQELDKIQNLILAINNKENEIKSLTESQIKEKTDNLKKNVQNGSIKLDDVIPESFALVREAAKRTLGERHYDVQLAGGLILHKGKIAEMKTGEGKTLVSTLPAYLNSLSGKEVMFRMGQIEWAFTAEDFILSFSLPNFYFHVTTLYDLFRVKGLEIGKLDFAGTLRIKN